MRKSEKMQDIGMEMETAMLWEIGRKWNKRERKKEAYHLQDC